MREDYSWGEVAEYHGYVTAILEAAEAIAEEAQYYMDDNGELINDRDTFVDHIQGHVDALNSALQCLTEFDIGPEEE